MSRVSLYGRDSLISSIERISQYHRWYHVDNTDTWTFICMIKRKNTKKKRGNHLKKTILFVFYHMERLTFTVPSKEYCFQNANNADSDLSMKYFVCVWGVQKLCPPLFPRISHHLGTWWSETLYITENQSRNRPQKRVFLALYTHETYIIVTERVFTGSTGRQQTE